VISDVRASIAGAPPGLNYKTTILFKGVAGFAGPLPTVLAEENESSSIYLPESRIHKCNA
jgi:hypothetical protein